MVKIPTQITRPFQQLVSLLGLRGAVPKFTLDEVEPIQFVFDLATLTPELGELTSNISGPSVGVASTSIVGANTRRKYLAIVNDSANVVYIALGQAAVLNQGIRLNSSGGTFEINENNLYTGAINGISSVAGSVVTVQELVSTI